jgi:hypothetical protein
MLITHCTILQLGTGITHALSYKRLPQAENRKIPVDRAGGDAAGGASLD